MTNSVDPEQTASLGALWQYVFSWNNLHSMEKINTLQSLYNAVFEIHSNGPCVIKRLFYNETITTSCTYQCFLPECGGQEYLRELDNFEKLGSDSLPMWHDFVSKTRGHAFKFRHNCFKIFLLKYVRSRPFAKVVCQIPKGSNCFDSLIPGVSLSPPLLGKNIDRMMYYIKIHVITSNSKGLPCKVTSK